MKKKVAIFGSTGSIGIQTLEVIRQQNEHFEVEVLTAFSNADLLIRQAREFRPNVVVIGNEDLYRKVFDTLDPLDVKVYAGAAALEQVTAMESIDLVMMAIVGFDALRPLLAALKNKKPVALANKESMVAAGAWITKVALENKTPVIPVDSEPSAIFQCLAGEFDNPIEKIVLTASGGPFAGKEYEQLQRVSPEEALKHPVWNMGGKTSIDSAGLMNKGLEAIEIKWLFDLKPEQIEILIHPQAIVHSMVYFADGSVKAQLATTDMKIPIQYALSYPDRYANNLERLDLSRVGNLSFEQPDMKKFRNLALAFNALKKGGNLPCILNAANELSVLAFLRKQIGFMQIPQVVEHCMQSLPFISSPEPEDYFNTDALCRVRAAEYIKKHCVKQ